MLVTCRRWRDPDSERTLNAEDWETAPDDYVNMFVRCEEGSVIFVECKRSEHTKWTLWRVECIFRASSSHLAYVTERVTEREAEKELLAHAVTIPAPPESTS